MFELRLFTLAMMQMKQEHRKINLQKGCDNLTVLGYTSSYKVGTER